MLACWGACSGKKAEHLRDMRKIKVADLVTLLGKFTGILDVPGTTRLWGRGTGTIVGVVMEIWGCYGVHRNKAKKRSPFERGHMMLDSAMFVY